MVTFNSLLKPHMTVPEVLSMIAQSSEFESMMVREVREWHSVLVWLVYMLSTSLCLFLLLPAMQFF